MPMIYFISTIHALTCIFIVVFILLQDPKGGVLGTLGGGGGSKSFFGSDGASPFLVNVTKWLAIIFACSSFYLSYMSSKTGSIVDEVAIDLPQPISSPSQPATESVDPINDKKSLRVKKQLAYLITLLGIFYFISFKTIATAGFCISGFFSNNYIFYIYLGSSGHICFIKIKV